MALGSGGAGGAAAPPEKNQGVRSTPWKISWTQKGLKFWQKGSNIDVRTSAALFSLFLSERLQEVEEIKENGIYCIMYMQMSLWDLKIMFLRQSIISTDRIFERNMSCRMWKCGNFLSSLAPLARIFIDFSQWVVFNETWKYICFWDKVSEVPTEYWRK